MTFQSKRFSTSTTLVLGLLCAQIGFAQVSARDRIVRSVDSSRAIALRGNVHPLARPEFDRGSVNGSMLLPLLTLFFKPTASQQADLDSLLAEQQDRSSPNYHRWLTPEQFGERFGVSAADLAKVTAWLQSQGFAMIETARGRDWVTFSGTAQQVSAALRTSIHRYTVNGETHYANASEPFVPAAFADLAGGFRGLDDFRLRGRAIRKSTPSVQPNFTSAISGHHFVTPGDFATIYDINALYNNGIDGTGQKIAVMGQTDISLGDIAAFRAAAGLAANVPQVMLIGSDPGTSSSDILEASLDVEWAGAVAKNATIIYVNSTDVINSMQSAIDKNVAPVISISYGACERAFGSAQANSLAAMTQQANAQGITIVASAGDSGATDCDNTAPATQGLAVDLPAGLPYVTGVGGTQFNEGSGTYWQATVPNGPDIVSSALSYIPEIVWNETPLSNNGPVGILASAGGASAFFPKPVWQTGTGVPSDGKRDVPDVSFNASPDPDGYLICAQGWCTNGFRDAAGNLQEIGGTSCGTPTFAGVVALINQQTQSAGQGNINYILYPLATGSPAAFHDITSGNNEVACTTGSTNCPAGASPIGYVAGVGYDQATGLGSVDVNNLVTAWTSVSSTALSQSNSGSTPDFQLAVSSSVLSVAHGSMGVAQITVTAFNGFSGSPAFTCSVGTALTGVTCAVVQGGSANTFTLQVTAPASSAVYRPEHFRRFGAWPLLCAIAAFGIFYADIKRRSVVASSGGRRPSLAPARALAFVLLVAVGCGGGSSSSSNNSGSPTGSGVTLASGSVGVTGTSGSISHTAQISVTVN